MQAVDTVHRWLTGPDGRRWLLRALLVYAAAGFVVWIQRPGDFSGYLAVGDLVLSGRHIYLDPAAGMNTWPPFFSLLCVPLALLAAPTPYLARGCWLLLNFGCLLLVVRMIAKLVYRRDLSLRAESTGLSLAAPQLLVPLVLTDRYVSGNFDHLQINLVIFALALGGLYLHATGRDFAGGIVLGCGAAIKVMPVIFIPYLGYRRRWRAALYAALAWAVLTLSPVLVFGWSRFWDYAAAWRTSVAAGWGVGKMNQSVFAMWDRFIGHGMLPFATPGITQLPESRDPRVIAAALVSLGIVTILALWIFRGRTAPDGWASLSEWSAVFIVSALFGPVCWKAYLAILLLPNTLLFAAWRSSCLDAHARRVIGGVLLVSFILGGVLSPGYVGKTLAERSEMASLPTVATLVLLGGLLWIRARYPTARGAPEG